MLEKLKEDVCRANRQLVQYGLVIFSWGNVSGIDRSSGLVVIKPSGVSYDALKPEDMAVVDLEGRLVEGDLHPSTDMPTHLELYKAFGQIGGVVHTHSTYAAGWAQAGREIPLMGTTQADYFSGAVPCTRSLTVRETEEAYERNTGKVIIEAFEGKDPSSVPGVICRGHGPFTWGKDCFEAVYHAKVLEEVSKMNFITSVIDPDARPLPEHIRMKHYSRKHGPDAYYGQQAES